MRCKALLEDGELISTSRIKVQRASHNNTNLDLGTMEIGSEVRAIPHFLQT